ncbi:16S rRNA (cytosine(967)-C(5))-methyltransferase [Spirulina sp. CS-785/01]|uniref:16S rRNA (cytosine(967)-C(5))-methyltransferase n=1 Tax=Spirulina sp. CS-785/01 TaxID=3021716 RepID=UPI00232C44A7|nr:16S rRNA (cytosine(967)-C(5))-methyltransferase [Spirulina sp. CS-785/01]MDB9315003.1 16S rRNA (cytosine(967)-C(5))-methyltransferase [Spirulina sp. CS-785/01]
MSNPRQIAFKTLQQIGRHQTYTDIALDRSLQQSQLSAPEHRGLVTELVYGIIRRQRTLDALINQLGTKPIHKQPPTLCNILRIGLYQLRYLTQIPPSAAVNTSVELAKTNGLKNLAGVVNGMLRQYLRLQQKGDPLKLPDGEVSRLGVLHSFPDWIVELWVQQWGIAETETLCQWFNQTPNLDLRINPLQTSVTEVEQAFQAAGVATQRVDGLPATLRLQGSAGNIRQLPGYGKGWWTVQDSSAQLVTHLLSPQPGEVVLDACAAPGGKSTHIAEMMGDQGRVWACDIGEKRLRKVTENAQRLRLESIRTCCVDSGEWGEFLQNCDRILLDVPCSGLGTLHRHPDIRWRQTPAKVQELTQLQFNLLNNTSQWLTPQGVLVYATCTLNPAENEAIIEQFLARHPHWHIIPPDTNSPLSRWTHPQGWLKVLPHHHDMDGFFMVKLGVGN